MEYDFLDKSTIINEMEMEENLHLYPIDQQSDNIFKPTQSNSNMVTTSDSFQFSSSNSNTNYQSFYFPSSFDSKQYHTTENNSNHFNYSSSSDLSSTYTFDPYCHTFSNDFSTHTYPTQTEYNSASIDSSTYRSPTDAYYNLHSTYVDPNMNLTPSSSFQWNYGTNKVFNRNITSTSNSNKQPCLVCHEKSSGYHFGAYTCESCKAFYRRVTKDPNIELKHSCDIPLPNITKSNRKDCRACRKAKCEEVGMTMMTKDRSSRTKTSSKSSAISANNLLEQLTHDLAYNQCSTSSALEDLFQLLDLSSTNPMNFDYHSLYMNAIQIWRNQYRHASQNSIDPSFIDTFAVLLVLFYCFMIMKENAEDKSMKNSKFDQLINILQEEINRINGIDHRLACRIKARFMKCCVTLAQYHPHSTNIFDSNHNLDAQSIMPYQQYSVYNP